ncbi:metal-dependent hydrolase [Paenibacillus sp. J31TS4]|uniref:metal-dependent hydrolase n=1 Tax=Paenibacillus sp. J31TS4 TaxID=2807195 RepID=UPI001BCA6CC8|nr:metal-dependent hydrolase [Paenibacillus sp. J31TS4]
MKGTTHLAIGVAIGAAAVSYYPFSLKNAALYMAVAAFSALSADLDGPSMLSGKLGSLAKLLREGMLWGGVLLGCWLVFLYADGRPFDPRLAAAALLLLLLGFVTKEGVLRNALVSAVGAGTLYAGVQTGMSWLLGLGAFVAVAPWLKHRGMTHTLWALLLWGFIGRGMESELYVEGLALVATAGYVSHLLADTVTPSGVKWLYPLYKKALKLK